MPSTVIKHYNYFPETEILKIEYQSGAVYRYLDVPQEVFDEFRAAFSKGVFLNTVIKKKFRYEKVEY